MERLWRSRLRWRMRGAWMWPAFAVLTVLDAIALHLRPIAGTATGPIAALLVAAGFNLVAVGVLAPLAGALLRRGRPDLPRVVAQDYAGTGLLVAIAAAVILTGALHRPAVLEHQRDLRDQAAAVHDYVLARAPAIYRAGLERADTRQVDRDLFRTCVPGPDPQRALCLFVDTSQSPPGIRQDPNHETNRSFAGRTPGPGG